MTTLGAALQATEKQHKHSNTPNLVPSLLITLLVDEFSSVGKTALAYVYCSTYVCRGAAVHFASSLPFKQPGTRRTCRG